MASNVSDHCYAESRRFAATVGISALVISGQTVPGQNATLSAIVQKRTNVGGFGIAALR